MRGVRKITQGPERFPKTRRPRETQGGHRRPREATEEPGRPPKTQRGYRRPREATGDPGRPPETQGGHRRPREATEDPGRLPKTQGGHRRPRGATGEPGRLLKRLRLRQSDLKPLITSTLPAIYTNTVISTHLYVDNDAAGDY